jgi:uncharacterized protein YpmB
MKKKDIITVIICGLAVVLCGYFAYTMLFPKKPVASVSEEAQEQAKQEFTGNIDNDTLNEIKKLNDYGEAPLDNIGRVNPFGPLN